MRGRTAVGSSSPLTRGAPGPPPNFGLPSNLNPIFALAIDPTRPATLYAGTFQGVFKSTNSGATWAAANTGLTNVDVRALAMDPTTTATLYAGAYDGGVFKSTDSGGSWVAVNNGLYPYVRALAIDPATPATLYVGTYYGVFKSTDSGGYWAPIAGLTNLNTGAFALVLRPPPSTLGLTTATSGHTTAASSGPPTPGAPGPPSTRVW